MEEINLDLDPFERVSMVVIADGPWTTHNDLMTPTLKIRRGALESRYEELIDEWRRQEGPVVWESIPGTGSARYAGAAAESSRGPAEDPPSQ
jgi:hypothetical protein